MRRKAVALSAAGLVGIAGLAGCSKVDDGGSGDKSGPIKLGVLLDVTGPGATLGVQEKNGVQIAVDEINAAGGIGGRKLEIKFADSQTKPDVAAAQAKALIDDGAKAIIGTSLAATCMAVKPLTEAKEVLQYCMSGADLPLGQYFYGASFDPKLYLGQLPSRWMKDKGFRKAACIATTDKSGQDYDRLFRGGAEPNGVQVVSTEKFAPGDTNVDTQVANIKSKGPEVLYGCVSGANIAPVVKAVKAQGLKIPVWAGTGATSLATANLLKADLPAGGVYSMGVWIQVPDQIPAGLPGGAEIKKFVQDYKAKFSSAPDWPAAAGYDAVKVLAKAYAGGATDGTQLSAKLQAIQGHQGLLSGYSFTATDHRGTTPPDIVLKFTPQGGFTVAGKVKVAP